MDLFPSDQRLDGAPLGREAKQHAHRGRVTQERRRRQPIHVQGRTGLPAVYERAHRKGPHDEGCRSKGKKTAATFG